MWSDILESVAAKNLLEKILLLECADHWHRKDPSIGMCRLCKTEGLN